MTEVERQHRIWFGVVDDSTFPNELTRNHVFNWGKDGDDLRAKKDHNGRDPDRPLQQAAHSPDDDDEPS